MADRPNLPHVDDPLAALRRSIENHAAVTQASVDAGQQLRSPAPLPEQPARGNA